MYAADTNQCSNVDFRYYVGVGAGLEVIKLEFILRLKIKLNDWLIADTCPQAANHLAFILSLSLYSSFITSRSGLLIKDALGVASLRMACMCEIFSDGPGAQ